MFIKLNRVCIPLGLECNFQCKYCYRGLSVGDVPKEISPLMREYLPTLTAENTQAVCMSGGEPLIYMDRIKEIFSLIKPEVHKKIMTNGSLLTQEIVDYINTNKIELMFSHDGAMTEFLRGRDVLKEPKILELIKQVHILVVACVITKYNPDIMENYRDIANKLGRTNFLFNPQPLFFNGYNQDLIDGFDYDTYNRSYHEYARIIRENVSYYRPLRGNNLNVDLDGKIVDKNTLAVYGTILEDKATVLARKNKLYANKYCATANCLIRENCLAISEQADDHFCRCARILGGFE